MDIHSIKYAIVMKYHDGAVCCNTTYLVLYMLVQHVCIIRGGRNDMYSVCIADSSGGIDTEQQCSYSTVRRPPQRASSLASFSHEINS